MKTMIEKQFVTYEIALALKELGFDEPCMAIYRDRWNDFGVTLISDGIKIKGTQSNTLYYKSDKEMICLAPLWQQAIDWCDSKGLLVGTIVVDNLYKSTINKINYETELFHSRNESIKRAIEFAISYLQDNK